MKSLKEKLAAEIEKKRKQVEKVDSTKKYVRVGDLERVQLEEARHTYSKPVNLFLLIWN